jgi:hypothetical protein
MENPKTYELTPEEQKALQALHQNKQHAEATLQGALTFLTSSKGMVKSKLSADFSTLTEIE